MEVGIKSKDTNIWHLTKMFQRRRKCSSQKLNVSKFLKCLSETETGRQKIQKQHLSFHPSSGCVVVSRWVGSMCFVLFFHVHSSKSESSLEIIFIILPPDKGYIQRVYEAHTHPQGGMGLIYPYQFQQLGKQMHHRTVVVHQQMARHCMVQGVGETAGLGINKYELLTA